MKNFLVISLKGESLFLAKRLKAEGHEVIFYVPKDNYGPKGSFLQTTSNWRTPATQADIIIFDSPGMGGIGSQLRKQGKLVFNGGKFTDLLVEDFEFADKVGQLVKLPHYQLDAGKGTEVLIEGWFNGSNFLKPLLLSFPKDRLLEGCKGPVTPGMGTTLTTLEGGKLAQQSLLALTSLLRNSKYVGVFGVLCYLTLSGEVQYLALRPGYSYDSLQALGEILKAPWGETIENVLSGKWTSLKLFRNRFSTAIRFSCPPYPQAGEFPKGLELAVPLGAEKHLWESCSGAEGVLGCITTWGETPREAQRRALRTASNMNLSQDTQYRRDIPEGVESAYKLLKDKGWFNG